MAAALLKKSIHEMKQVQNNTVRLHERKLNKLHHQVANDEERRIRANARLSKAMVLDEMEDGADD